MVLFGVLGAATAAGLGAPGCSYGAEPVSEEVREGARVFYEAGCVTCHTYAGEGASNLGAPDLTRIGVRRDRPYLRRYVANPRAFGDNTMPAYAAIGSDRLDALAAFLEASDGSERIASVVAEEAPRQ